jgi:hypothetical protein
MYYIKYVKVEAVGLGMSLLKAQSHIVHGLHYKIIAPVVCGVL